MMNRTGKTYTKDDVHFMKCKMNEFAEQIAPIITHDDKLTKEKNFEEFVKKYAKVLGNDVNMELLVATVKEMLSKLSLDFN